MELIDVLNTAGAPTGQKKPKSEVHRDGDWHRAVHVWIVGSDGRVLLQRRSVRKENNPGLWDVSAAGHISAGEGAVESAIREVEEELGLRLDPSELRHVTTLTDSSVLNDGRYIDNEFHEIFVVYRDVDLGELTLQETEVDEVALVTLDEMARYELVPHGEEYELLRRLIDSASSAPLR
jgi:isopentenyl-diphosphate Delta-isomerase